MSLWCRRRDKWGRLHHVSLSIPLLLVVGALLGPLVALLLPRLAWMRDWVQEWLR